MEFLDSYFEDEVREGFFVPSLMKRAWAAQMEVLEIVQTICDKHDIPLFAEWGTLLGAVRHKGRIPWDDDIDVCMLRQDYDRFCQVVDDELPEECWFLDYHKFDGFDVTLGRVINSRVHVVEGENLEKYHGFPYVAGIDIFWLDSLPEDGRKRKQYKEEIQQIFRLIAAVRCMEEQKNGISKEEMEYHIQQLERRCHVRIRRDESLRKQLSSLLEKKTVEMGQSANVKDVTNVYFWRKYENYYLPKASYEKGVFLDFENIKIRVPENYTDILARKYGEDWRKPIQSGGLHDYPSYAKQQAFLQEENGGQLFEYQFSQKEMEQVRSKRGEKVTLRDEVNHFIALFQDAHEEIRKSIQKEEWNLVLSLLEECQNTAIEIGTRIEQERGEDYVTVKRWEQYCELIFQIHTDVVNGTWAAIEQFADAVGEKLNRVMDEMAQYIDEELKERKEVVFVPYKASLWDSMQKMWETAMQDQEVNVYVVPAPYYYKDVYGKAKTEEPHYETTGYPENVTITHYENYNFQVHHPDTIVIQCPYDEYNYGMTIHPFFYAKNLVEYTENLVYIPALRMDEIMPGDDRARYNLKSYCNMPGVVYADQVIVQSEHMQKVYVELLTEFAGENTKDIWEAKITVSTPVENS